MNPHYAQVAERASHRCEYCHAPEAVFNFPFEVEHIVPLGRGGLDQASNLALSCRACNLFKGDKVRSGESKADEPARFFNPRTDLWNEHFAVEANGMITGFTEIGRATVASLQMNRAVQLEARQHWMRLRLFP